MKIKIKNSSKREEKVVELQKEKEELLNLAGLGEIKDTSPSNMYTFVNLEGQKIELVRMIILESYLQMDTKMGILVSDFLFHHCREEVVDTLKVINSKKYQVFDKEILNNMSFLRKLSVIKGFIDIPKKITKNIDKINDLRNGVAHELIPSKLGSKRVIYKDKDIFTVEGVTLFIEDTKETMSFLQQHFVKAFENNEKN